MILVTIVTIVINSSIGVLNIAFMMQSPSLSQPCFLMVESPILRLLFCRVLNSCFVHRVQDSKVKLKMAQTKYTLEKPDDVAKRIEKGIYSVCPLSPFFFFFLKLEIIVKNCVKTVWWYPLVWGKWWHLLWL